MMDCSIDCIHWRSLSEPRGATQARQQRLCLRPLPPATIDRYRNTGSFVMIQVGSDKSQSEGQIAASLRTVRTNALDGLIFGGDDRKTNAAILA